MKFLLLSIPSDFADLPDFLALCRDLIVTDNPFWKSLILVFIYHSIDQAKDEDEDDDDERYCPEALQKLLTDIESHNNSKDLQKFARLFQTSEHGQELVPNDRDSFLQVVERFLSDMIDNLPSLPGIRFENNVIDFLQRHELSAEGIVLSQRIMERLRWVHSLKICEDLMNILNDMNFKNSSECLVYRGFELLLNLLKLIQESNGVIYTYIHACILIQTSTDPQKIRELCAWRGLFTTVTFWLNDESSESTRYDIEECRLNCYLLRKDRDDFETFLLECLLEPDFLQTLEELLQCSDESDLENFAAIFMNNSEFVGLFRRYIQENPKTWCRA